MDHDDDLVAYGFSDVTGYVGAGEYADAPAPARDAAELARWGISGEQDLSSNEWQYLARYVLAVAPVVAAARALADTLASMWEADPTRRPYGGPAVDLVAAVRALDGDA